MGYGILNKSAHQTSDNCGVRVFQISTGQAESGDNLLETSRRYAPCSLRAVVRQNVQNHRRYNPQMTGAKIRGMDQGRTHLRVH